LKVTSIIIIPWFPYGKNGSYKISDGVTSISNNALDSSSELTSVIISDYLRWSGIVKDYQKNQ
jgi:hypothetical protein